MEAAEQILKQLGGTKFLAMTGATCYSDNNTLVVKFKGSKVANIMYVTLNESDLYNVRICKYKDMDIITKYFETNIYSDYLRPIFESVTKLRTSL